MSTANSVAADPREQVAVSDATTHDGGQGAQELVAESWPRVSFAA